MSLTESNAPKMNVQVVELYVSAMINLLNNGYTWYTKDDLGFGSIQTKLNATVQQIDMIRMHPKLKDIQTSAILFKVVDDTMNVKPQKEQTVLVPKEEIVPASDSAVDAFMSM